jgi:hypothetical protein
MIWSCLSNIRLINDRGDEALSGIVKGVPVSAKTRRLILFTHYLPLAAFTAGYLFVVGLGVLELARGVVDVRVATIGYMGATLCISGGVVWIGLGAAWVLHVLSALREISRT